MNKKLHKELYIYNRERFYKNIVSICSFKYTVNITKLYRLLIIEEIINVDCERVKINVRKRNFIDTPKLKFHKLKRIKINDS